MHRILTLFLLCFFISFCPYLSFGEASDKGGGEQAEFGETDASMEMLLSIVELETNLKQRLSVKKRELSQSSSDTEKNKLKLELDELGKQLNETETGFERIATGIDVELFKNRKPQPFDWQNEVVSLVEPAIKEIKRLTVKTRKKAGLKEDVSRYDTLLPHAVSAVDNISKVLADSSDKRVKKELKSLLLEWKGLKEQIESKRKIAGIQLAQMEGSRKSLMETIRESTRIFFRTKGLFIFIALVVSFAVVFLLGRTHGFFIRFVPGYQKKHRPFQVKAFDLVFRVMTLVLTLFSIVLVFYLAEDWVLLSITVIFLIGIVWALKYTLPKLWAQSRLMLNIGSVREGERLIYHGIPWLVSEINFFSSLENPALNLTLRIPIEELLDKVSRPIDTDEPWFPCKRNDWVILGDGIRGKVISLSHEMVELVQRGGAHKYYQTGGFLALSPLNLSMDFRLKVVFGLGYDLQKEAVTTIPATMESFIGEKIQEEGYGGGLLNLKIEFQSAGASSLDLVVIADFKGEMAPLYNRLNRAIQRWCVDACNRYGWDIPFPQLTIHQGAS